MTWRVGRRGAVWTGFGLVAGCAADDGSGHALAQSERPSPPGRGGGGAERRGAVTAYVPPPCPAREGDIVGVLFEGPSEEGVAVFGQAFRAGDLPRGAGLAARVAGGGRALPAQCDVLARHPDGSARHAAVGVRLPRLAAGERAGVLLSRAGAEVGGAPLALDAALQGREAVLEIRPLSGGGQPWRADLLALWRAGAETPWQSGPLAVQGRVRQAVPPAACGGVTSLRVVADLGARADGTLWADVWLRNDVAMRPGGGEASYAVRLLLDGREALSAELPSHPQYMGWGRLRGARRGGGLVEATPHLRPDTLYLAAAAAVAPYDVTVGVREEELERMERLAADPRWDEPFHARGLRRTMGDPGARPDLGLTTMWQAAWLVCGDRRAARVALGQAETAANVPWSFWDPAGGNGAGGWLDVRRWPRFWSSARGERTLAQPIAAREKALGWSTIPSHAPALSYVPYLLTARRGFLDNHMAQAAWVLTAQWPAARAARNANWATTTGARPSPEPADDVLLMSTQLRQSAWSLRTVGEAVWIAPEGEPLRDYFRDVEARNWQWIRRNIPEWTQLQGEAHGYFPYPSFGYNDRMALFSNEYFCVVAAMTALRGHEDAREVVSWQRNFLVGRFFQPPGGLLRNDTVAFRIGLFPSPPPSHPQPPQRPFQTWREIGEQTRALGISNGDGWKHSNGEYARLAMLSLAMIHRVFRDPRALEAYDWVAGSGAPFTNLSTFERMPQHNVSPEARPKVPSRASGCRSA